MSLNTCNLETRIQQKIDGLTAANDSIEFVVTNLASETNVKSSIANTASLPNIYTDNIPAGTVVFVESLGVPVVASRNKWLGLDGRLLQRDFEFGLWSWGRNERGVLGDGTTVNKSSPVSVIGGFIDWIQVSSRDGNVLALRNNGTLWSWGDNRAGRIGDNTTVDKCSPVSVVGAITDWCQVAGGDNHSVALRDSGTLWAWGCNNCGVLGDGTTVDKSSPVSLIGGFTDWCKVSTGFRHTMAIKTNGTLWAWGDGSLGRLGDGTTVAKSSPVSVVGGFTDWCQISAGGAHSAAVRSNGTLWTWGYNPNGQLGDGTTVDKSSPVSVIGGFTDWCQASSSTNHTAAVRTNGTLWTWGNNCSGKLGNNSVTSFSSPVSVLGGFTDWCQVSAGVCNTSAVRTNGTLWSWGANIDGSLGDNTSIGKSSPVTVVGGFTNWCLVSSSMNLNSFAIRACIL
jgi:alpha-tubulin suppressor-like RCC1 family protein